MYSKRMGASLSATPSASSSAILSLRLFIYRSSSNGIILFQSCVRLVHCTVGRVAVGRMTIFSFE